MNEKKTTVVKFPEPIAIVYNHATRSWSKLHTWDEVRRRMDAYPVPREVEEDEK